MTVKNTIEVVNTSESIKQALENEYRGCVVNQNEESVTIDGVLYYYDLIKHLDDVDLSLYSITKAEPLNYTFNPTDFGFEDISRFPQPIQEYFAVGYLKVTAISEPNCFWFKQCRKIIHNDDRDQRWTICEGVYDKRETTQGFMSNYNKISVIYKGIISSESFATALLENLMSATNNESIKYGKERLADRTMNEKFKI